MNQDWIIKNKMKIVFYIAITIIFLSSCNHRVESKVIKNSASQDTMIFKAWLKDTVNILRHRDNQCLSKFAIPKDSSFFEIKKECTVNLNSKDTIADKDLKFAVSLLEEQNLLPKNLFQLTFNTIHSYSVSPIHLKYEYVFEISKFEILEKNRRIKFYYIKGNLIDKKIEKI